MTDSVIVTFWDPLDVYKAVENELKARLPLHNLHWNSNSRPLRSIQSLNVTLQPYYPQEVEKAHQMLGVLQTPYLNTCFVACEEVDAYRSHVRAKIREWYNGVFSRKHEEWLIVLVVLTSKVVTNRYSSKSSVVEKIKSDFNVSKRDRVVSVKIRTGDADEAGTWTEFIGRMKEGILDGFDGKVTQYEDDTKRLDSKRNMPGWNFCTFFALKEGLALSFENMKLVEDALTQYAELEVTFHQVVRNQELAYFPSHVPTDRGDDSAAILLTNRKPYRTLILENSISTFDLRCYMFARQAQLLLKLNQPVQLCHKTLEFLIDVSISLQEHESDTNSFFMQSFAFSVAAEVIEVVSNLSRNPDSMLFSAISDLYGVMVEQLSILGGYKDYLPHELAVFRPISLTLIHTKNEKVNKITNAILLDVLGDKNRFLDYYQSITEKSLQALEKSERETQVDQVLANLASLKIAQENFDEARDLFERMTLLKGDDQGWSILKLPVLISYSTCLQKLSKSKEYLLVILHILKHYSSYLDAESFKSFLEAFEACADNHEFKVDGSEIFSYRISHTLAHQSDRDGIVLHVDLRSPILGAIDVQNVDVKSETDQGLLVWFLQPKAVINKRWTRLSLVSNSTHVGTLQPKTLSLFYKKVEIQCLVPQSEAHHLVVYPAPDNFFVVPTVSGDTHVASKRELVVAIFCGQNDIGSLQISFKAAIAGLRLHTGDAVSKEVAIEDASSPGLVICGALQTKTIARITFPFTLDNENPKMIVSGSWPSLITDENRGRLYHAVR